MKLIRNVILLAVAAGAVLTAQRKVDVRNMYERVVCVVPIIGKGTMDDPRRPMFAPLPGRGGPRLDGILAFSWVPSDDGNFALVEFVARERTAFKALWNANRADVRVFERDRTAKAAIESEFQRHRRSFSLDQLRTVLP